MHISPPSEELKGVLADPDFFSSLDNHFAMFIARLAKMNSSAVTLAAAMVSRTTGEGNVCLDLAEHAEKPLCMKSREPSKTVYVCPSLDDWTEQLLQSCVVGQDAGNTPLVLDGKNRLYLRRYWQYEKIIVRFIQERAIHYVQDLSLPGLRSDVKKLFQVQPSGQIDWQLVAAISAVTRSFSVISGGPGTGKTTTVAKILALLLGQYNGTGQPRILLGAPTGKAASRLQKAIADAGLQQLDPKLMQTSTLHRMLGSIPNSPYFLHNQQNPLAADIVVIDEASMVDLPLLAKLMQAVPDSARLILLGDRHQLASVEPGSVLGDICRADIMPNFSSEFCKLAAELGSVPLTPAPPARAKTAPCSLSDSFVELAHNYRFSPESSIAKLGRAVKKGDGAKALDILLQVDDGSISWSEIPAPAELGRKLQDAPIVSQLTSMALDLNPGFCFRQLDNFRILCALRSGPFGLQRVNDLLEQMVMQRIKNTAGDKATGRRDGMKTDLSFRPIMVTRNDYNLQLFNGDVGLMLPDPENRQKMRGFFRTENGIMRDIAPALLPDHETVFAMTVHKSQGSECSKVLLILPERDTPILTRELIYTAITRAREKVEIWGRKTIFVSGVKRQIKRASGLAEKIWGADL